MGSRNIPKDVKTELTKQYVRVFAKESHAKSLVEGIARKSGSKTELVEQLRNARKVVEAVQEKGVTSFFSAEYGKLFDEPKEALSARKGLISRFMAEHGLEEKQAAKMADCIVFSAAKKQEKIGLERVAALSSEALAAGVPFTVAADVAYYNAPDVPAEKFARRCVETSLKQNKPMSISEVQLAKRLVKAVADHDKAIEVRDRISRANGVKQVVEAMNEFGEKK